MRSYVKIWKWRFGGIYAPTKEQCLFAIRGDGGDNPGPDPGANDDAAYPNWVAYPKRKTVCEMLNESNPCPVYLLEQHPDFDDPTLPDNG